MPDNQQPERPPVTHHVFAAATTSIKVTATPAVMTVTRGQELPAALSQRSNSITIDNPALERQFARIGFWQGREGTYRWLATLMAMLLALAIALQYKLEFGWQRDWKINRLDGKITLTPR